MQGNKVLRVGTNREIQRLARAQTTVIDAKGGSVLPGFNDAHVHMMSGGLSLDQVSLSEATTLESVKETAEGVGRGATRRTTGFAAAAGCTRRSATACRRGRCSTSWCPIGRPTWSPTTATPAGPTPRRSKLAGITRATAAPVNGIIVKDARGEPTGVLKEAAMSLMSQAMPVPSRDDKLAALRAAIVEANRVGITSVQNAGGSADDLEPLRRAAQARRADGARLPGADAWIPRQRTRTSISSIAPASSSRTIRCSRPAR